MEIFVSMNLGLLQNTGKQTENSFKDKMNKFTPVLFFCLKNCLKISSWVIFSLKKYLNRISSFCFVWLKRQFWLNCRYYLTHSRGLFVSRWPWKMQIWWPFNNSEASRTSVSLPASSAPLCAPYEMKDPLVTCWSCYSECERTVRMTCSLLFFHSNAIMSSTDFKTGAFTAA